MVGSLIYLTVTRPDISYVVHQVSQYLSTPRSIHYAAVLRILRYLRALFSMAFSTQLSLLLYSVHSLMLIGQRIPLIAGPLQVIAFSLVLL